MIDRRINEKDYENAEQHVIGKARAHDLVEILAADRPGVDPAFDARFVIFHLSHAFPDRKSGDETDPDTVLTEKGLSLLRAVDEIGLYGQDASDLFYAVCFYDR